MAITFVTFKTRFPEFDSVADARIDLFLADALIILNEVFWGTKYDLGVSYYTAHKLALAIGTEASRGKSGAGGPVSSRSVDGASVSYSTRTAGSAKEAYYSQTQYGVEYWSLLKSLPVAACVI